MKFDFGYKYKKTGMTLCGMYRGVKKKPLKIESEGMGSILMF